MDLKWQKSWKVTAARAFMCQHKRGSESDKGGALGLIIRIHFQAS